MGFVYILKGKLSGKYVYYVGSTLRPLADRLQEHLDGKSTYTSRLRYIRLVWSCEVENVHVRSVEFWLKRHRYTIQALVGKIEGTLRVKNFYEHCERNHIEVRNVQKY